MDAFYQRRREEAQHPRFTAYGISVFAGEAEKARRIDTDSIRRADDTTGTVRGETVDTAARRCSCLIWQENWIPYQHAIAHGPKPSCMQVANARTDQSVNSDRSLLNLRFIRHISRRKFR